MADLTKELKALSANLSTKREPQQGNKNKYTRGPGPRGPKLVFSDKAPFQKESVRT